MITLADEEEELLSQPAYAEVAGLAVHEERLKVWPPWPWPPWGPEDPDDPGDGDDTPTNRTEEAKKLAQGIIVFEKKLANASLDL